MVDAVKRSQSIVQVGMQRRSYDLYLKGRDVRRAGTLGTVRAVRSWWLNNYLRGGTAQLKGPLDWEQWQGPAPRRPMDPQRFFQWRFFAEYAGGIVADQGAHVFDGIHLIMDLGYPAAVNASAGRAHKQGVDTPETVVVAAEYPDDFLAIFTINYAAMRYRRQNDQMNHFDGDGARMDIGRETMAVYKEGAETTPVLTAAGSFDRAVDLHVADFLACVRTRRTPTAPVELGFQAALVVQMANRSLKEGRRLRWNAEARRIQS
jgi:predicted dehydrogenase